MSEKDFEQKRKKALPPKKKVHVKDDFEIDEIELPSDIEIDEFSLPEAELTYDYESFDEFSLPDVPQKNISSGRVQQFELKEASLDEPIPTDTEKIYYPREREFDPNQSNFVPEHSENVDDGFIEEDVYETVSSFDSEEELIEEKAQDDEDDNDFSSVLDSINNKSSFDLENSTAIDASFESNYRMTAEDNMLLQGYDIDKIIAQAINMKASDIHIIPYCPISITVNGDIVKLDNYEPILPDVTLRMQQKIVTNEANKYFNVNWELDTSYTVRTGYYRGQRTRLNASRTNEEVALTLRIISDNIPTIEEIELEQEISEWCNLPNGLIMMNGKTNTGKSTTIASMIQNMQHTRKNKIITIEKPVEYLYKDIGQSIVLQREVGKDTLSYAAGLDSAMRSAPNVIVIGEVRNKEEVNELLRAAETGQLAISTMHCNSAPETINRIKSLFTGDEQNRILDTLSEVSRGFANQVLIKTKDGKKRFAVREILPVTSEVKEMILRGDTKAIRDFQFENKMTIEHKLVEAVDKDRCTIEEARAVSSRPLIFDDLLKTLS